MHREEETMRQYLDLAISYWNQYWGDAYVQYVMIAALMIIAAFAVRRKEARHVFFTAVLTLAAFFMPPFIMLVTRVTGESVYWRFLWLFPTVILISYVLSGMIGMVKNEILRFLLVSGACVLLIISGSGQHKAENFVYLENWLKIPDDIVKACDLIREDSGGDTVKVAAEEEAACYVRVYDPSFYMPFGRWGEGAVTKNQKTLYTQINLPEKHYRALAKYARDQKCNYLIISPVPQEGAQILQEIGYHLAGSTETYEIYANKSVRP